MLYKSFNSLVVDYCHGAWSGVECYETLIKPNEKELKKWFKEYKKFEIHFCDPAPMMFCYDYDRKYHGFALDEGIRYDK